MSKNLGYILVGTTPIVGKIIASDSYGNAVVCPTKADAEIAIKTEGLTGYVPKPLVRWQMNIAARTEKRQAKNTKG